MKSLIAMSLLAMLAVISGGAATAIRIDSDVSVEKHSTKLEGFLSKPQGPGPFPTVVLMHGCGGLIGKVPASLRNHASFFNAHGFAALVLDSFGPRGKSSQCGLNQLGAARYYRSFDAFNTLAYLKTRGYVDPDNVFLVGQSNGGSVALIVAGGGAKFNFPADLRYTAVAAYYPWCGIELDDLVSPLIVFGGGEDDWVPPANCKIQQRSASGEPMEVIVYDGVHHSFDLPIGAVRYRNHTLKGDATATRDSRKRMLDWFTRHMD